MLEKDVEKKVCDYAKKHNALVYKFTSPNRRSVPDRLIIFPGGRVWFVEFKRPGGKPTEAQEREIKRLREKGCYVSVIDTVEGGKELVDQFVEMIGC